MEKKHKIRAYIFLSIFVILVVSFGAYRVISVNKEGNKKEIEEKVATEKKYIDKRLTKIFNQMNNIKYESYKISINTVNSSTQEETNQQNSKNSEGENQTGQESENTGKSEKGSDSESADSSETGGKSNSEGENSTETEQKKYQLQEEGILTQKEDIDWQVVKNNIEKMYVSIPTITLDFYQTNINDENILNFNTEFDNLTKIVQDENKVGTLNQLCKIYEIYVKFIEESDSSEQEKTVAKTKLNIFRAYSNLDEEKWEEISKYMKSASEEFSKLMTSTDMKEQKQYSTNKSYIMINELYKTANIKDTKIFLIKYKNTIEELENM